MSFVKTSTHFFTKEFASKGENILDCNLVGGVRLVIWNTNREIQEIFEVQSLETLNELIIEFLSAANGDVVDLWEASQRQISLSARI